MKRTFVCLAACFALVAIALASSTAHAGDHGNKRSAFSQSGGNGGGNGGGGSGPSMKSMKLHSSMSSNLSGLSTNNSGGGNGGGGGGNGGSSSFNPTFSRKMSKSFAQMQQSNSSLPGNNSGGKNLKFSKDLSSQLNSNLFANPSFNANGRARRTPSGDVTNKLKFADAFKSGKFQQIDSGIGNGTDIGIGTGGNNGNGKGIETKPGKFKVWNPEKLADVIKHEGNFPIGDGKKFDDGKKYGPDFGDKFCDTPNQNKKCHDGFPWWKLWVNCYPNDCYPNNCYPNDWNCHNHNHCYPPIYYNYPPVTNVTVVNPLPPLAAQPALVEGIDLELVDLRLVDIGDPAKNLGPRYRITYRNRGTLPAGNFQVMLLASSDGTPKPGLPSGSAEVAGVAPGQLLTADVRLTMTPDISTLTSLIVAVDSASQILETEEANNVAVIDRAKVGMADLAAIPTP